MKCCPSRKRSIFTLGHTLLFAFLIVQPYLDKHAVFVDDQRLNLMKFSLDKLADFFDQTRKITFMHALEMIEADETICTALPDITDADSILMEVNLDQGLSKIVHDNDALKIGGNRVPLFAMVSGGRSRTFFSFRGVFPHCSSLLDARIMHRANWVMWISHKKGL